MKKALLGICFSIMAICAATMASAATMTTAAGNGSMSYCGDGGPATEACLATPFDVTFDDAGNYYIADHSNDLIRKVDRQGIITTVAGGGWSLESGLNAREASIRRASALAFLSHGGKGYLYISDRDNGRAVVLDVDGGKVYNVLTNVPGGTGGIRPAVINDALTVYVSAGDGRLIAVTMSDPITPGAVTDIRHTSGIAHMVTYAAGGKTMLVMNEYWAGLVSRMDISDPLAPTGYTVIAGGGSDRSDTVTATAAFLVEPYGLVRDSAGNLYVSEHAFWNRSSGNRVRKIAPNGTMTTVAGVSGVYGFIGDGGTATEATFYCPTGLALDPFGNLFVGDDWNHRIRKVSTGCTAPPSGMIGWWPGDGSAIDIMGGHNGALMNGTPFTAGVVHDAFSFDDAQRQYVKVPHRPDLDLRDSLTIELWVMKKGSCEDLNCWLVAKGNKDFSFDTQNGRYGIFISDASYWPANLDNRVGLSFNTGVWEDVVMGTTLIQNDVWYHVAGTWDGSVAKVYVNGVLENSVPKTGTILPTTEQGSLTIGAEIFGDYSLPQGEHFDGLIDEVGLYSRALSADEITSIYDAGSAGKCRPGNRPPVADAGPDRTVLYDLAVDGAAVTLDGTASSDLDGDTLTYAWTWDGGSATGPAPAVVLPLGATIVTLTVDDGNGGTAIDTAQISVAYSFGGFLAPVSLGKAFMQGSTVPVKFRLTDAQGRVVSFASALISLVQISDNEPLGDVVDGTSNVPDAGNAFRYDPLDAQYIYNLATGSLDVGTWRVIVSLDDGSTLTTDIKIK